MANMYGKGDKGKATKLHSELVRARGRCERCGSSQNLQCAHIISRKFAHTRCLLEGSWCLCASCHRYLTDEPYLHVAFAVQTLGEDGYAALRAKAQSMGKVDWAEKLAELKAEAFVAGLS